MAFSTLNAGREGHGSNKEMEKSLDTLLETRAEAVQAVLAVQTQVVTPS